MSRAGIPNREELPLSIGVTRTVMNRGPESIPSLILSVHAEASIQNFQRFSAFGLQTAPASRNLLGLVYILTRPSMRLSGLQREVLSLYRSCLRASRKKPAVNK